jgi:hypothetical protein
MGKQSSNCISLFWYIMSYKTPTGTCFIYVCIDLLLTFQSLAVSLLTTRVNNQKFYMVLALR